MFSRTRRGCRRFASFRKLLIGTTCLIQSLAVGVLHAEPPVAQTTERPTAVGALSSVNAAYADLQFLFELVGNSKDYQTLKETLDLLVTGVDPTRPCLTQLFARPTGTQRLNLLPVATDEDFHNFLRNLWDADMRSAPAPELSLASQIPPTVRQKLKSLSLDRNERLMFDLWDGFARLDGAYALLAQELTIVRHPVSPGSEDLPSTISLRIDGTAASADQRHQACSHSNSEEVAKLTRRKTENETAFALRKSLMNFRLAVQELVFAESAQAFFHLNLSHPGKQVALQGSISPIPGSPLADCFARHEKSVDRFSRISETRAAVSGALHVAVPSTTFKAWKSLLQCAKAESLQRINSTAGPNEAEKSEDREFAELICDMAIAAAAVPVSNAFIRIWQNEAGSFDSIGGIRLSATAATEYRDRLSKLRSRKQITGPNIPEGIAVYQVVLHSWPREYREFFDHDGTILVAEESDTLWFASGEQAVDRLAAALQEKHGQPGATSDLVMDLSVDMGPLSNFWKKLHDRRSASLGAEAKEGSDDKKRSPVPLGGMESFFSGLDLPSIAAAAYQSGKSNVAASVKRLDGNYVITANADEGTLRFAGLALTQFVRENIGE